MLEYKYYVENDIFLDKNNKDIVFCALSTTASTSKFQPSVKFILKTNRGSTSLRKMLTAANYSCL